MCGEGGNNPTAYIRSWLEDLSKNLCFISMPKFVIMFSHFTDINECDPNPCLHSGVCLDKINGFKCVCKLGYTGQNCETSKQE